MRLLDGEFPEVDKYYIIDCRFNYEFEGGHIKTAVNMPTMSDVVPYFIDSALHKYHKKPVIIFHCEFSSARGPAA